MDYVFELYMFFIVDILEKQRVHKENKHVVLEGKKPCFE